MLAGGFVALVALTGLLLGLRVVGGHERLGVMRLGRFVGVRGPGAVWVLPFLDRTIRIDLDRDLPGWQSLSPEGLTSEIGRRISTLEPDRRAF